MLKILIVGAFLTALSCSLEQTPSVKVSADSGKSVGSVGDKRLTLAVDNAFVSLRELAASWFGPRSLPLSCSEGVRRWPPARRPDKSEFHEGKGKMSESFLMDYPGIADCIPFSAGMYDTYCSHAEDGRLVCFCGDKGEQAKSAIHVHDKLKNYKLKHDCDRSPHFCDHSYLRIWSGGGKPSTHTLAVRVGEVYLGWLRYDDDETFDEVIDEALASLSLSVMDADLDNDGDTELVIRLYDSRGLAYATEDFSYQTFILQDSLLRQAYNPMEPPVYWGDTVARLPFDLLPAAQKTQELDFKNDASLGFHGNPSGGCSLVHVEHGFLIDTASGPFYRREIAYAYKQDKVDLAHPRSWTWYFRAHPTDIIAFEKTGDVDAFLASDGEPILRGPGEDQP